MLKLGINKCDNESYHKDRKFKSSSTLKLFLKDPREYYKRYVLKEEREEMYKSAYDFGSYMHSLILEPHKTVLEFAVFEGATRRGKAYEEFKNANEGKTIITASQAQQALDLLHLYNEHVDTAGLIQGGVAEHTLCVELDGMPIKVRADYIKEGMIIDVKTTSDPVDKFSAAKTIIRFDYDLSAALYVDAFKEYTGQDHDFVFAFLNKQNGDVGILKASEDLLNNGRKKYKTAIKNLAKAEKSGIYFKEGIQEVDLPSWAEFKE
mgnify:FL=1|tara:strand:- start:2239 stop:3030 length:792 start_codon:yes stop_codon:yes gene_type:complete